ncbi:hypothetical protein HOF65_05205 [bacterium]|nr:hypothetical protein [bacterium]MBT3853351.1 hypothetical protein [bacterium]MBT4633510.1 hypothetical protein [bacterium]MBT5492720.1 hypothetical protein [bacterium]MBT6779168.1 hypothetical protein [bacterium]
MYFFIISVQSSSNFSLICFKNNSLASFSVNLDISHNFHSNSSFLSSSFSFSSLKLSSFCIILSCLSSINSNLFSIFSSLSIILSSIFSAFLIIS